MAIDIQMPDFETSCAILETKASISGIKLGRETIEYLANNIKTNIRELEGALNQLLAYAEMRGITPDISTAEGLIGNVRRSRPQHVTPKQIIDARRPIRSDKAPNTGWSSMKHASAAVIRFVATLVAKPAEFTRYFCMYVVNV